MADTCRVRSLGMLHSRMVVERELTGSVVGTPGLPFHTPHRHCRHIARIVGHHLATAIDGGVNPHTQSAQNLPWIALQWACFREGGKEVMRTDFSPIGLC
jgi:hypothetical protein